MHLIDAGPLVALLSSDDEHHAACKSAFSKLSEPPVTVWPALTEAMYFLGRAWGFHGQRALWGLLLSGSIRCVDLTAEDCAFALALMEKYADRPMDLADASLVAIAERYRTRKILTIDRSDFEAYRVSGKPFEITPTKRRR